MSTHGILNQVPDNSMQYLFKLYPDWYKYILYQDILYNLSGNIPLVFVMTQNLNVLDDTTQYIIRLNAVINF